MTLMIMWQRHFHSPLFVSWLYQGYITKKLYFSSMNSPIQWVRCISLCFDAVLWRCTFSNSLHLGLVYKPYIPVLQSKFVYKEWTHEGYWVPIFGMWILYVLNDYIESWNYKLFKSFWNQNILLYSACL